MAKRIKKGGGAVGFVLILVALAMLVVAIVGVCIDWISTKVTAAGYTGEPIFQTLSELFDDFKDSDSDIAGKFKLMAAFAILTVILAGGTTVFAGITKVLGWKLFKFPLVVIAIVCVICGVVSIITTYTFCDQMSISGDILDWIQTGSKTSPYIGAWLTPIGGVLCGLVGVGVAVKS